MTATIPRADAAVTATPARTAGGSLGALSPLRFADEVAAQRRRVPVQPLAAIVLAALAGSVLLGTALTSSIRFRLRVAEEAVPAEAPPAVHEQDGRGDSLRPRAIAPVKERRTFAAPFSQVVAGQEVIRTGRFERLSVRLATIPGEEPVPESVLEVAMQPAAARGEEDPIAAAAGEDADVVVTRRPLDPGGSPQAEGEEQPGGPALSEEVAADEVRAFERGQFGRFSWLPAGRGVTSAALGEDDGQDVPADAFSHLSVEFIPENVTTMVRRPRELPVVLRVPVDGSRPLTDLLAERGLPMDEAGTVAAILAARGVQQGRVLALEAVPLSATSSVHRIQRVSADAGEDMLPIAARDDQGRFVAVSLPEGPATPRVPSEGEAEAEGVPLYATLYRSGREAGLSHEGSLDLLRLFASDYDLEAATGPRDTLDILAMEPGEEAGERPLSAVLAVQLSSGGRTRRLYRAPEARAGDLAFVDGEGRSFHAALDTKPLLHARLTSRFGGRYHPILHYTRPHNGIDWAARIGTPVLAAGDGEVIEAGPHSGYGRHVEIRHAEGYVTTYSHLDRIARDLVVGRKVARGEVIGFLGQSGLATGPHLHFEYKLNGVFVDPLTVKVPRPRLAEHEMGARFASWTQQIDRLVACENCEVLH